MNSFVYKVTSKKDISIVCFTGKIGRNAKSLIEDCCSEVLAEKPSLVVIYFKDIVKIETAILRDIILLQHEIRKNKIKLYIAGLDNNMRDYLIERAVIRTLECKKSLMDVFDETLRVAS